MKQNNSTEPLAFSKFEIYCKNGLADPGRPQIVYLLYRPMQIMWGWQTPQTPNPIFSRFAKKCHEGEPVNGVLIDGWIHWSNGSIYEKIVDDGPTVGLNRKIKETYLCMC